MCAEHTKISVQIIEIKTIYKYNKSRPWLCGAALLLVRRIGMTKPPVKLGVDKKFLEKRKEPPSDLSLIHI